MITNDFAMGNAAILYGEERMKLKNHVGKTVYLSHPILSTNCMIGLESLCFNEWLCERIGAEAKDASFSAVVHSS